MRAKALFILFSILLVSCRHQSCEKEKNPLEESTQEIEIPQDTTLVFNVDGYDIPVDVHFPDSNWIGTMIVLQGWDFPRTDWCEKTELCAKALKAGYALVCPDMGKSIYSLRRYPETRKDWLVYPTRTWVNEELIPYLSARHILKEVHFNCALGLSTGARGAFFLALDHPELFGAVACLSGDYDQRAVPTDNLYRGFFGSLTSFPDRWSGDENPMTSLDRLKASVYLAHGLHDEVVAPAHTRNLCAALKSSHHECHLVENAAHDYSFWGAQVDPVLAFFSKVRKTNNK